MFITKKEIKGHPTWLYVFGDNLIKKGLGGQAKVCRGEPNTLGIPTKRYPTWEECAFFKDEDFDIIKDIIDQILEKIDRDKWERIIIFPRIGEGRAQLPYRAPTIYAYIKAKLKLLEK